MDKPTFFFAIFDHDNEEFSLHGPMSDGSVIRSRVHEAAKKGRKADASAALSGSRDEASAQAQSVHPTYKQVRFVI